MARLAGQGGPHAKNPEIERLPPLKRQVDLPSAWLEIGGQDVANHVPGFRSARGNIQKRMPAFDAERLREGQAPCAAIRDGSIGVQCECTGGQGRDFPDKPAARLRAHGADFRGGAEAPRAEFRIRVDPGEDSLPREGTEGAAGRGAEQGLLFAHPAGTEAEQRFWRPPGQGSARRRRLAGDAVRRDRSGGQAGSSRQDSDEAGSVEGEVARYFCRGSSGFRQAQERRSAVGSRRQVKERNGDFRRPSLAGSREAARRGKGEGLRT